MPKYIAFCKPYGVLTSFTDPEGRSTLAKYVPVPGVYSAGRLDLDSEGLLILTDDGDLIHRLTDPQHHLPKTYLVQVEGIPTPEALAALECGPLIQGYKTKPCKAQTISEPELFPREKPITPHGPVNWLKLELEEGKKRQIRHMTAAVGLPTLRLVRVAIGTVRLGDLQPGQWRELNPDEIRQLKEAGRARKSTRGWKR